MAYLGRETCSESPRHRVRDANAPRRDGTEASSQQDNEPLKQRDTAAEEIRLRHRGTETLRQRRPIIDATMHPSTKTLMRRGNERHQGTERQKQREEESRMDEEVTKAKKKKGAGERKRRLIAVPLKKGRCGGIRSAKATRR